MSEMKLRRFADANANGTAYRTLDGRFQIEKDFSLDEYDAASGFSWYVYTVEQIQSGHTGPPDALHEAPTLAECRQWLVTR